ncbi:gluconate 2-dehydrogenase subunit 3 family protein [Novosphingobium sp. FSY-8]|uniref:Gluconate 2-dehydrogenase subunit 3 family protein n=1 Tax=Novosphingobium ovatum TaxID=1908523 RepID=A0ABW9XD03_9SPHN|nr:gluconate 2-dehydrogenase subunit 3 family protein [Novosphingobium ovatum]NBC36419.1 gluconate 2-dehydrogenase subunit 3 family protein [Novosphingobium ovatum]
MTAASSKGWKRRDFLAGATLLAVAAATPVDAATVLRKGGDRLPTPAIRALMKDVAQLVIPRTKTAGAGDVGAGDFVLLALAHGLEGAHRPLTGEAATTYKLFLRADGTLRHADWLQAELNRRAGTRFIALPLAKRRAVLVALDTEAFAARDHPWKAIKNLILTGYYTSEIGGSKELNYELVPGRFDPDLPLKPTDRAFSSDWSAVDFG